MISLEYSENEVAEYLVEISKGQVSDAEKNIFFESEQPQSHFILDAQKLVPYDQGFFVAHGLICPDGPDRTEKNSQFLQLTLFE